MTFVGQTMTLYLEKEAHIIERIVNDASELPISIRLSKWDLEDSIFRFGFDPFPIYEIKFITESHMKETEGNHDFILDYPDIISREVWCNFYIEVNPSNNNFGIQRMRYATGYSKEIHDEFFEDSIETIDFRMLAMGSNIKLVITVNKERSSQARGRYYKPVLSSETQEYIIEIKN